MIRQPGRTTAKPPRVSVVITAYNAQRYVAEAIDSVLSQTFRDFELIIIDDGSTDNTAHKLAAYQADARLQIVFSDQNGGPSVARNRGIDLARGEYIAFLDADDRCLPERLAIQTAYLDSHRHIAGVGTWMTRIDEQGRTIEDFDIRDQLRWQDIACHMLVGCPIAQGSMMVRKTAFAGYRYDPSFRAGEDHELWARMIRTYRFSNLSRPLTEYRRHPTQTSTATAELQDDRNRQVFGRQAKALGLEVGDADLRRHECLFRLQGRKQVLEATGEPLDLHFVRWARAWLEGMQRGNAREQIYPEPEFSRMLATRWLFVCRKGARSASSAHLVWAEFFRSSLTRAVLVLWRTRLGHFASRRTPDEFHDPATDAWLARQRRGSG